MQIPNLLIVAADFLCQLLQSGVADSSATVNDQGADPIIADILRNTEQFREYLCPWCQRQVGLAVGNNHQQRLQAGLLAAFIANQLPTLPEPVGKGGGTPDGQLSQLLSSQQHTGRRSQQYLGVLLAKNHQRHLVAVLVSGGQQRQDRTLSRLDPLQSSLSHGFRGIDDKYDQGFLLVPKNLLSQISMPKLAAAAQQPGTQTSRQVDNQIALMALQGDAADLSPGTRASLTAAPATAKIAGIFQLAEVDGGEVESVIEVNDPL